MKGMETLEAIKKTFFRGEDLRARSLSQKSTALLHVLHFLHDLHVTETGL
jgi:hypothetical protein